MVIYNIFLAKQFSRKMYNLRIDYSKDSQPFEAYVLFIQFYDVMSSPK
jgi:hypothetical protein